MTEVKSLNYLSKKVANLAEQLNTLRGKPIEDEKFLQLHEKIASLSHLQKKLGDYLNALPLVDDFSDEQRTEILEFLEGVFLELYRITDEINEFFIECLHRL